MQEKAENMTINNLAYAVETYGDMLMRVALNLVENTHDAEDSVQETYLRYLYNAPVFADAEHEKAWLIRVCVNVAKNIRRGNSRRAYTELSRLENLLVAPEVRDIEVIRAVTSLPEKYRIVVYLHYFESMTSAAISTALGISDSLVRKRLQKGRELLKLELE